MSLSLSNSPQRPQWEATLISALTNPENICTRNGKEYIDFSAVEKFLERSTPQEFIPKKSVHVEDILFDRGIFSLPDDINREKPSVSGAVQRIIHSSVPGSYEEIFSHKYCALYLAPTLLKPLLFSKNAANEKGLHVPVDAFLFRKLVPALAAEFEHPQALQGILVEMKRHLLLGYQNSGLIAPFERYVEGINSATSTPYIKQHPFFSAHARSSLATILYEGLRMPPNFSEFISSNCGGEVLKDLQIEQIVNWISRELKEIHRIFEECRVNNNDDLDFDQLEDEVEDISDSLEANLNRFSGALFFLLLVDDECKAFRRHATPRGYTPSDLASNFYDATRSMLQCLGQTSLNSPLSYQIPDRISQVREKLKWYLDEIDEYKNQSQESFFTVVNQAILRLVENSEFISADNLLLIAPAEDGHNGAQIPHAFQEMIDTHQQFFSKCIAEKMGALAEYKNPLGLILQLSDKETAFSGLEDFRSQMVELGKGINAFLNLPNRSGTNPLLLKSLRMLIPNAILIGSYNFYNNPSALSHDGFQMMLELFQSFGSEKEVVSANRRMLGDLIEGYSFIAQDINKVLNRNNAYAQELLDLNREDSATLYRKNEKTFNTALQLYESLPKNAREFFDDPTHIRTLRSQFSRGEVLREIMDSIQHKMNRHLEHFAIPDLDRYWEARHYDLVLNASQRMLPFAEGVLRSITLGEIKYSRETQEKLVMCFLTLGDHCLLEMKDPRQKFTKDELRTKIYTAESYFFGALIYGISKYMVRDVAVAAGSLCELYSHGAKLNNITTPEDSESYKHYAQLFSKFHTELSKLIPTNNRPLSSQKMQRIFSLFSQFSEHQRTQELVENLGING